MRLNGTTLRGLLALALAACPAGATTLCVSTTGAPPCYGSIQAAVDAAVAGDTISIGAGVYTGRTPPGSLGYTNPNVNIPAGKDGLKIVGSGAVVVDPEFNCPGCTWNAFDVYSNSVSFSNLTVRNGRNNAIYAGNNVTGLSVTAVKFLGATGYGVWLQGGNTGSKVTLSTFRSLSAGIYSGGSNDLTIASNTFAFVDYPIYVYGTNVVVTGNKLTSTGTEGIFLSGNGAKITSNILYNGGTSFGIEVYGNGHSLTTNQISSTGSSGIYAYGDGLVAKSNSVTNTYGDGIEVYGNAPQVGTNTIKVTGSTGIYVSNGGGYPHHALISGNKVSTYPGGYGIEFHNGNDATLSSNVLSNVYGGILFEGGDNPNLTLNTVSNARYDAYYLSCYDAQGATPCTGGTVKSNKATDVGASDYCGFEVYNTANGGQTSGTFTLASNNVLHAGSYCYLLTGSRMAVTANLGADCGMSNFGDGVFLVGTQHTLTANNIQRASVDGFKIWTTDTVATTTTLSGNTSTGAGEDGFDVHASRVTLTGNKSTNNAGAGFEVGATDYYANSIAAGSVSFTGGNVATGNALGACFSLGKSSQSGTNSYGTPDTPVNCNQASGYIGN